MLSKRSYKVRHGKITLRDGRSFSVPCLYDEVLVVEGSEELLLICEQDGKPIKSTLNKQACINGCLIQKDELCSTTCPLADRRYCVNAEAEKDLEFSTKASINRKLGKQIITHRCALGMSRARLSELSSVASSTITHVEKNTRPVSDATRQLLKNALQEAGGWTWND